MNIENRLSLYKDMYYAEEVAREQGFARIQFVFASLLAVFAASVFILEHVGVFPHGIIAFVSSILALLSMAFLIVSGVFLALAIWGHNYLAVQHPLDIEAYRAELDESYKNYAEKDELSEHYLKSFLLMAFAEAATRNTLANEKRARIVTSCFRWLVAAATILVLALASGVYSGKIYPSEPINSPAPQSAPGEQNHV